MSLLENIVKILSDNESHEPKEVAQKLLVSLDYLKALEPILKKHGIIDVIFDAWLLGAGAGDYWPMIEKKFEHDIKDIEVPLTERSEVVISSDKLAIIDWAAATSKRINPSLDFLDGIMYVSQNLPFITENSEKEDKKFGGMCTAIITSEGRVLKLDKEAFFNGIDGIKISSFPDRIENRWSTQSIQAFVRGVASKPSFLDVFTKIRAKIEENIEFKDPRYYSLFATWVMGTYFFPMFPAFPYIYIMGTKRSGKSKLLLLSSGMSFNGKNVVGMTTSTIFRLAEGNRASLHIDELEGDKLAKDPEFRALLLQGYKKGATVPRSRKLQSGRWVIDEFTPYSPKMLVNIRGIDDVMEDRTITVIMERGTDPTKINKNINLDDPFFKQIRDELYVLCLMECKNIYEKYLQTPLTNQILPKVELVAENRLVAEKKVNRILDIPLPEETKVDTVDTTINTTTIHNTTNSTNSDYIHNKYITLLRLQTLPNSTILPNARDRELSLPLLIIAGLCDQKIFDELLGLLHEIFAEKKEEDVAESADNALLVTLLEVVNEKAFYKISNIANILAEQDLGKWVNTRWVGRAIKRLGITHAKRCVHGRVEVLLSPGVIKKKAEDMGINIETALKDVAFAEPKDDALRRLIRDMCFMAPAGAPLQDVITAALDKGIPDAEKMLEKMKAAGLLIEPKPGLVRVV